MSDTPTFATLGAVNHGKSSVVSTLAENDQVRISAMPGETVECQRFSLGDLFVFYDTPGFQNATEALEELRPAGNARDPLQQFREFIARHKGEPEYEAECYLFEPVVDGAGIIYVVDGSRPVLDINLSEMEILRLTGAPRLAIINRTSKDDHVADWKRRLGLHFNAVREFNAHYATFADRIELLETLAGIEQSWKPKLSKAVQVLREGWEARLEECAEVMVELLEESLRHRETSMLKSDLSSHRKQLGEELKERYMKAVAGIESRSHERIISLFGHRLVKAGQTSEHLFANDLFSDETWQMFGLDSKQLVAAGAVAGAVAGASVDVLTAGHTLLAGSAIGAAVGAASAFALGKGRPELAVDVPGESIGLPKAISDRLPRKWRVGGSALAVGPYRALNFPWILLDRAIGTFAYVINRAHGRRDEVTLQATQLRAVLEQHGVTTAKWDDPTRKACERIFTIIRRGKFGPEERLELRNTIHERLEKVAAERMIFDSKG
ncbi:GTPase/DUF3482 domain-containing protein [Verrucomicrobiota bacterium sgz303538]